MLFYSFNGVVFCKEEKSQITFVFTAVGPKDLHLDRAISSVVTVMPEYWNRVCRDGLRSTIADFYTGATQVCGGLTLPSFSHIMH